jgi:hypothetical protein
MGASGCGRSAVPGRCRVGSERVIIERLDRTTARAIEWSSCGLGAPAAEHDLAGRAVRQPQRRPTSQHGALAHRVRPLRTPSRTSFRVSMPSARASTVPGAHCSPLPRWASRWERHRRGQAGRVLTKRGTTKSAARPPMCSDAMGPLPGSAGAPRATTCRYGVSKMNRPLLRSLPRM